MVDFKLLAEKSYEEATPEQRERIDAYRAREARLDLTRRGISATFTHLADRMVDVPGKRKPDYEVYPIRTETKTIDMRIEEGSDFRGQEYETIKFIGGSTGHEEYRLDADFVSVLTKDRELPENNVFSICAGSARYARCEVSTEDVIAYLKEVRPNLFEAELGLTI